MLYSKDFQYPRFPNCKLIKFQDISHRNRAGRTTSFVLHHSRQFHGQCARLLNGTHSHLESTRLTSSEHSSLSPHLSSTSLLQSTLNDLIKNLLSRNGYRRGVLNYNMSEVPTRNRKRSKDPITTVLKRDVFIVLRRLHD